MAYADRASVEKLGELDPELAEVSTPLLIHTQHRLILDLLTRHLIQFLKNVQLPPPADYKDYAAVRHDAHLREQAALQAIGPAGADVSETYQEIPMRDGTSSKMKLIRPHSPSSSSPEQKRPLIVLFFGGGFVTGSCEQLTAYGRSFARVFNAVTVCASYRLAPEHPFPQAINDAWDAVQWAAANARALGATPEHGFVVGGVSAGAHVSGVSAQLALDVALDPPVTGQFLSVPAILTEAMVPDAYKELYFSLQQNADVPVGMNGKVLAAFVEHWKPDSASPLYSPMNAVKPLVGMPPAYIQVDGMDPLRDDGLVYEKMLRDHGVATRLDVYPGLPHAHWAFFPMLKSSVKASMDIVKGMGWLLGHEVDDETARKSMAVTLAA